MLYAAFPLHVDNDEALIRYLDGLKDQISAAAASAAGVEGRVAFNTLSDVID